MVVCALAAVFITFRQHQITREMLDQTAEYERFNEIVERASQSVVALDVDQKSNHPNYSFRNSGSGFVLDRDGIILTNEHVVHDAIQIRVTLGDKRNFYAEVMASDPRTDLAIVKIDAEDLQPLTFADPDKVAVGQIIIALGNPLGTGEDGHSVATFGIINKLNQPLHAEIDVANDRYYDNLIQTNAITLPGNSGGPLINTKGQVIGINTAMATSRDQKRSFGFAIALDQRTQEKIVSLKQGNELDHAFLGVSTIDVTEEIQNQLELRDASGALVDIVLLGSPAQYGGLSRGDVILSVDEERIHSSGGLIGYVNTLRTGQIVQIELIRLVLNKPEKMIVPVQLTSRTKTDLEGYQKESQSSSLFAWGMELKPLTAWRKMKLRLDFRQHGVLIYDVEPQSPAYYEDIKPGDVIIAIEDNKVDNLKDFAIVAKKYSEMPRLVILPPEPTLDFGDL
jgi:serine protease Do